MRILQELNIILVSLHLVVSRLISGLAYCPRES